jgi:anti-sigma factor RsiW
VACAESLRVLAYFDGEVDALSAAAIEEHIERCVDCRALLQDLERTRAAIHRHVMTEDAPAELRARVLQALREEAGVVGRQTTRSREAWRGWPFWLGASSGAGVTALAAALVVLALGMGSGAALAPAIEAAHLRSLMPAHLIDVESADRHTVKPWFAGHADVSPVVADFSDQGYRLIGGRADYLAKQRAAVVVYRHGPHVINVFSWAAGGTTLPSRMTRAGFHMASWRMADVEYCAVSDTGWEELDGLVRLLRDVGARDAGQGP